MVWFGFIWNFGDLDDGTGVGVSGGVGGGVLAVSASLLFEPVLPLIVVRSFFVLEVNPSTCHLYCCHYPHVHHQPKHYWHI